MFYVKTKNKNGVILCHIFKNKTYERKVRIGEHFYFVTSDKKVVDWGEIIYIGEKDVYMGELGTFEWND